jgi:hypothetical protein
MKNYSARIERKTKFGRHGNFFMTPARFLSIMHVRTQRFELQSIAREIKPIKDGGQIETSQNGIRPYQKQQYQNDGFGRIVSCVVCGDCIFVRLDGGAAA